MIRSLFLRWAAVAASLIFLAPAAMGQTVLGKSTSPGLRFDRPRVIFDRSCTDTFNVPATTVNVNVATIANWDTLAEAVNPDRNVLDAVQTSGSADGWCDSRPWIIKGTFAPGGATQVYVGPIQNFPKQGVHMFWNAQLAPGNYQHWFGVNVNMDSAGAVFHTLAALTAAAASLGPINYNISPVAVGGSQYVAFERFQVPVGVPLYYRLNFAGAGAYSASMMVTPLLEYYEEN
jgi:hypothetical protein